MQPARHSQTDTSNVFHVSANARRVFDGLTVGVDRSQTTVATSAAERVIRNSMQIGTADCRLSRDTAVWHTVE